MSMNLTHRTLVVCIFIIHQLVQLYLYVNIIRFSNKSYYCFIMIQKQNYYYFLIWKKFIQN